MATYLIKADTLADGVSLSRTAPRKFARDSNGNLFAVYYRNDGTRNQIYISKSGDGGENWAEYKVTDDTEAHESPSVGIDSNNYIYIVCIAIAGYNTYDIWQIVKSTNGGESWGSPADINPDERDHQYPVIAIDSSDYIHIACNKVYTLYDGIIYTKSIDGGSNWDASTSIAGVNYLNQRQVAIAIDSNDYIHLAFIGAYGAVGSALRYRKYTDSWQTIENLASEARERYYPSIAIDGNDYIHIAWCTAIGVYNHIKYIKYTDSWQAIEYITTGNYQHYYPSISVDDDNEIYVVFYGYHAGSTTYRQIGYNHYTDSWSGMIWLTSGSIHNRYPNAIFARWPIDGSAKVNIPDTGFAFIWAEDDDIKIYLSADLTWQGAAVIHEISGTIAGVSGVSGNLSGEFFISGQIDGVSSITGNASLVAVYISGVIAGQSGLSGNIFADYSIAGQIDGVSGLLGNVYADYSIAGQIVGISTLEGALIRAGVIPANQIRILDRNENLKKILEVVDLVEHFTISSTRYIQITTSSLPADFTDGWYIYTIPPANISWSNSNKWRVEKFRKFNTLRGLKYIIIAEHMSCELLDEAKASFELTNSTATAALTAALLGTNWSVGTVDVSGNYNLSIKRQLSVLDILHRIASRWKGELYFTNTRKVDLKTQLGSNNNLWFRRDKNVENIEVECNSQGVVTRLYAYGKDGLNISSVNAGKEYLDSQYVNNYPRPKVDTIYTQHEDAQELKDYALVYLSNIETPKVIYKLSIADLSVLTEYLAEEFEIGDTVVVYDKKLGIKISTRIKEIHRNYCYPERSSIVLANTPKLLSDFIAKLQKNISMYIPTGVSGYEGEPWEDVPLPPSAEFPICFVIYVGGILTVGIYQGPIVWVHTVCTAVEIYAYCKWKPTISDVVVGLAHNGIRVGEVSIPFGEYVAPGEGEVGAGGTTSINLPLVPFDRLNIDIDAVDGVGAGVIVQVRCVK